MRHEVEGSVDCLGRGRKAGSDLVPSNPAQRYVHKFCVLPAYFHAFNVRRAVPAVRLPCPETHAFAIARVVASACVREGGVGVMEREVGTEKECASG